MCGRDFSRLLAELHRLFMRLFMEVAIWKRFGLRSRATGRTRPVRASQGSSDTGCAQSVPRRRWRLARSVDFSEQEDDLLDQLAEEYQKRLQRGEDPNIEEYAADHPEIAEAIRELFQTIKQVEDLKKSDPDSQINPLSNRACPAPEELAGRQLGDFQIIREIGRGGMGVVYEATQISLKRRVALKVLESAKALDSRNLQRFQIECQAAAGLRHPNIVPVFCVDCVEGVHYYAMQFIEGCNLADAIDAIREPYRIAGLTASNTPLRPNDFSNVARLGMEAAKALEHAHQQGIAHRDIKPANLMVDAEANLWVTDFGLARLQSDSGLTVYGDLLGTLRYMSPEQASGQPSAVDHRTDIYSLGATIYELLTLRPAIKGKSRQEILRKIAEEEPIPPRVHNRSIPRDLETIVLKAMDKDLKDRYQTALELADDLGRFRGVEPIHAKRPTFLRRLEKWTQRNRRLVSAAAVMLLISVVCLAAGAVMFRRQRNVALLATELASQSLYAAQMNLVQRNWEAFYCELFLEELVRQLPGNQGGADRRGFEWFYWLRKASGRLVLESRASTGGSVVGRTSIAFSPDGKWIALGGGHGTVEVWNATTGQGPYILKGPRTQDIDPFPPCVAFSPDSKLLASAGDDTMVKLWDTATWRLVYTLAGHTGCVGSVAFSSDGKSIASYGSDFTVRVWDLKTKQNTVIIHHDYSNHNFIAFTQDGKELVIGSSLSVHFYDLSNKEKSLTIRAHTEDISSVAFSPDGKWLATAGSDRSTRVWNGATPKETLHENQDDSITSMVKVWDAKSGKQTFTFIGHEGPVRSVVFSPDGKRIASVGTHDNTVKVWDAISGREALSVKRQPGALGSYINVAFSPDGKRIACSRLSGTVEVLDAGTEQGTLTLNAKNGGVRSVAFSPDGKRIAAGSWGDTTVKVWDASNEREPITLEGHQGGVLNVAFSLNGERLAAASADGTIKVWDVATWKPIRTFDGDHQPINGVAFSPDGIWIAAASSDWTLKVWDASNEREPITLEGHQGEVLGVAFSPDRKRIASASADGTVKVWDVATWKEIHILKGHAAEVHSVVFSPDSKWLTTASNDRTVKLWDAAAGREIHTLTGHAGYVYGVAFGPNGERIASASADGTVKVWDVTTGLETLTLKGHAHFVFGVAFSPDGERLASASADGSVRVWDGRPLDGDTVKGILDGVMSRRHLSQAVRDAPRNAATRQSAKELGARIRRELESPSDEDER